MIEHIYIDGIQIDNDNTFLQNLGNIGSADVSVSNYNRGGKEGQVLSKPMKRGFAINITLAVLGDDYPTFITQRDRLIKYLQNNKSDSDYFKTLGFELADGTVKEIDVIFSKVTGNITPKDILYSQFTVTATSEKEYLRSRDIKTTTLTLRDLGGMTIPMDIPMGMNNNAISTFSTLSNLGNSNGCPSIRIYAPFSAGFNIKNETTNETLSYSGTLSSSDYVDLDFYNHTAIKNSTDNVLGYVTGDWFDLVIEDNILYLTGSGGDTGYGTVTYNDYYVNI
jgi:hypothetical protein